MKRNVLFYLVLTLPLILVACRGSEVPEPPTPIPAATPTPELPVAPQLTQTNTATPERPGDMVIEGSATPIIESRTNEATVTTEPCQKPDGWVVYTVRPGDTLFSLGQATGSSVDEVVAVNCLPSTQILAGQPLFLSQEPNIQPSSTITRELSSPLSSTPTPELPDPPDVTATVTLPPSPTSTSTATPEQGPAPGPGDPRLIISPTTGPIPTLYTATLENYSPNETITIEIFFFSTGVRVLIGSTIVDGNGNGSFSFSSEEGDQPGMYILVATSEGGLPPKSGEFRIDESYP